MVRGSVCTCAGGIQTFFFLFFNVCFYLLIDWLICFCFVFPAKESQEKQRFLHESDKILSGFHEMTGEENKT